MSEESSSDRSAGLSRSPVLAWIVGYGIVVVFFALCGWYMYTHRSDFLFLKNASYGYLALAGLCCLSNVVLTAVQFDLFFRHFGLELGYVELTSLSAGMTLGNLTLPMRGGTGALLVYLKKAHGLNLSALATIYGGTGLLALLIFAGTAGIALCLLYVLYDYFNSALALIVTALFAVSLYLSVFPPPLKWKSRGLLGIVFETASSWHALSKNRPLLARLTLTFLLSATALTAALYFIYKAIGAPLSAPGVLITSGLGNIANLAPITPGAMGVFDAVTIKIPQMLGLDLARSIAAALVFRAILLACALASGIPGALYLAHIFSKRAARDSNPGRSPLSPG